MNTNHYPSLELCKKLTEVGFPPTEIDLKSNWEECIEWTMWRPKYVYPSVLEMLDVIYIPLHHRISIDKMLDIDDWVWYNVSFYSSEHFNDLLKWFQWTLPNAIAEMILWLHENNFISFSK